MPKNVELSEAQHSTIANYASSFKGSKNIEEMKKTVPIKEALTSADANILMPKVIQQIVLDSAQEQLVATPFFKRVNITEGRSMEFVHFGALRAQEVSETGEYPEQSLNLTKNGVGSVEIKVKKYGIKISISDEMIADSQWDVVGLHLEAAGRAMAALKEENAFREMTTHGHTVFDNGLFEPGDEGYPTGRGFNGEYNGTLSAEDIQDMAVSVMSAGFNPTTIIMHPLCWSLFAKNEALVGSNVAAFGQGVAGNDPRQFNTSNALGLEVVFSPYVPFNQADKTFDFYLIDKDNVGVQLVKEEISTEQFDNPMRDIQTLKLKERYGLGVLNGGLGVAVARNVEFKKTYPAPERVFDKMDLPSDMKGDEVNKHDEI